MKRGFPLRFNRSVLSVFIRAYFIKRFYIADVCRARAQTSSLRPVAQLVELRSPKPPVVGSNPAWPVTLSGGTMSKVIQFFRESKAELKKVVWPSRDDVVSSVIVVIVSTFVVAVILGLLDLGFTAAFRAIMK